MLKFKKMGSDKVPLLLVTANVGSIFEDPSVMLPIWTAEFLQAIARMDPKFIALHLQEVGGKAYEKSMQYVQDFVQRLSDCPELRLYDKIRTFLDEDFSSPDKFTALGNMYFAHTSLTDLKIWDFEQMTYVDVVGKEIHSGNIEDVATKEKVKFPQHFFPECKWSRKGFLRTRWSIRGTSVEFVNIHLFHDASNLVSLEPYPSVYCRSRRRALRHTLRHLHSDINAAPYFIFGDFNFRTDTGGVVQKITEELTACRLTDPAKMEASKLQYKGKDNRLVLTIGKKEFSHVDHQKIFREPWLQRFDRELEALRPHLFEFPVKFPPSYPFEEDVHLPTHYMKTRCPAWCDRILLSQSARLLVQQQDGRPGENRHIHSSRKSVTDSTDSSGRVSSSDSSPARSGSPARNNQGSPGKTLCKKNSVLEIDALSVAGFNVSRKSIADPTSVQQALLQQNRVGDSEVSAGGQRRKLVRNQSEGSPKGEALSAELRRLVDAPARKRTEYAVMGGTTCMGDHKPIYLRIMLQSDRGNFRQGFYSESSPKHMQPEEAESVSENAADSPNSSCPAWCDRILLSQSARLLVQQQDGRPGENRHIHSSRKSVTDSTDSSGRVSSSDSSPARSGSPARNNQGSPGKTLCKKNSVLEIDALSVAGFNVSRKSIADPTSVQQALLQQNRVGDSEVSAGGQRRKLVRNQSEGSPKGEALSAELRRLVDAPARKRTEYAVMGGTTCMGDHKPIYLRIMLQSDRGNFRQGFYSESSPKHMQPEEAESVSENAADSPNSRYIHFNSESPNYVFKETDI